MRVGTPKSRFIQYPINRDFGVPTLIFSLLQVKTNLTLPTTVEVKKRLKINQNSQENCKKILEKRKNLSFPLIFASFLYF